MRKLLTISMSALMMGFMATSCSNDEGIIDDSASNVKAESYICVNISEVGASTSRATTDEGFAYGTADERKVTSAMFYFFDDNDHLVTESSLYGDGTTMSGEVNSTDKQAVEFFGKAVIPLHDLNPANLPTKMVTVLNPPTDLSTVTTLNELLEKTTASSLTASKTFTMSTSSYKNGTSTYYCVTDLTSNDFYETETDASSSESPVQVYVERLAVKVDVTIDATNTTDWVAASGTNTYKLGDYNVIGLGEKTLYIRLLGWGLNATTQKTNIMKDIDLTWADAYPGFTWNDATNHRSYWGKSYNYGDATCVYPDHYISGETDELKYLPSTSLTNTLGFYNTTVASSSDYCNENTNTGDILKTSYQSTATCVLVLARITTADGSETGWGDLIKYNGKFYTPDGYINMVYTSLVNSGKLAYKHGGTTATAIALSDLCIANGSYLNGRVVVALNTTAAAYTDWVDASGAAVEAKAIDEVLASINNNSDAIGFKNGLMYYNIPIEHLNQADNETSATSDTKAAITKIHEGHYGVVRNHWYKLTINKITGPGHGIQDPDEPIVPNPDVEEDYYIGARINILAWKTLSQTVSL
jgi:hypothetical protein